MPSRRSGRANAVFGAMLVVVGLAVLGYCGTVFLPRMSLIVGGNIGITTRALPEATMATSYNASLTAEGGTAPYKWSVQNGWLPAGLKLDSGGTLAGTPELPGEFYFTALVTDSSTPARSANKPFVLRVPTRGLAIVTSNSLLPWARAGSEYQVRFTAWGGVRPYNWAASGPLPRGLKLQRDGTLAGIPEQAGDFRITVLVSDLQRTVSREFSLHVSAARVDMFGGVIALHSAKGGTGNWRTEKIGKRWVMITPAGNAFWMTGIWGVTGDTRDDERGGNYNQRVSAKYRSNPTIWLQANRRLRSWGFNSVGPWSYRMVLPTDNEPEWGGTQPVKFPYTVRGVDTSEGGRRDGLFKNLYARLDKNSARYADFGGNFPDVFDPAWVSNTHHQYAIHSEFIYASKSPYFLGAFSDETDNLGGFGPGAEFASDPHGKTHSHLGYIALVTAPVQVTNPYSSPAGRPYGDTKVYTKLALRDFLKAKYGTIEALNAAWHSSYTTFDSDGGWPNGNGLLDENGGTTHKWLGTGDPILPPDAGAAPNLVKDLDEFLYRIARQLLSVQRDAFRAVVPNGLFFGPTSIGGWWAPARAPIYRAAGEILDVVSVTTDCSQAQLDFITRAAGDVPLIIWEGMVANPDSSRWRHAESDAASGSWQVRTQAARGQRYRRRMDSLFSGVSSATGSSPYVGIMWWWWLDMISEQMNWGLVSLMDNSYDGMEASIAPGIDAWGYPTGGEEKNYGDFIGPAREMNYSIIERLSHEQSAGPAGPAGRGK